MKNLISQRDFDKFQPNDYLHEYYSHIGPENDAILAFLAKAYKSFEPNQIEMIEIGGGPTIYQLISASVPAKTIHFTDFLDDNLSEINSWVSNKRAYNWDTFIKRALKFESKSTSKESIDKRALLIREKITDLTHYDIFDNSLKIKNSRKYDLVSTHFVAESVASNYDEWKMALSNIVLNLKNRGFLIMSGLIGAKYWITGDQKFSATYLKKEDVLNFLEVNKFTVEYFDVIDAETDIDNPQQNQGYKGMFFVKAIRNA